MPEYRRTENRVRQELGLIDATLPWKFRLASWLLCREAESQFKRSGESIFLTISRSISAEKKIEVDEFREANP